MRASLCNSSAAFLWLGPGDNGAESGLSFKHGKMERQECGEVLFALMTLHSLLCVLSEMTHLFPMTQASFVYIYAMMLSYC